jgi:hypothetical protein
VLDHRSHLTISLARSLSCRAWASCLRMQTDRSASDAGRQVSFKAVCYFGRFHLDQRPEQLSDAIGQQVASILDCTPAQDVGRIQNHPQFPLLHSDIPTPEQGSSSARAPLAFSPSILIGSGIPAECFWQTGAQ